MTEMWYYTTQGKQQDPVNISELRRLPAHFGLCVPANRDLVGH